MLNVHGNIEIFWIGDRNKRNKCVYARETEHERETNGEQEA